MHSLHLKPWRWLTGFLSSGGVVGAAVLGGACLAPLAGVDGAALRLGAGLVAAGIVRFGVTACFFDFAAAAAIALLSDCFGLAAVGLAGAFSATVGFLALATGFFVGLGGAVLAATVLVTVFAGAVFLRCAAGLAVDLVLDATAVFGAVVFLVVLRAGLAAALTADVFFNLVSLLVEVVFDLDFVVVDGRALGGVVLVLAMIRRLTLSYFACTLQTPGPAGRPLSQILSPPRQAH